MNGSYDPYPDFSPLYEPTSFSWWLFSLIATVVLLVYRITIGWYALNDDKPVK